MDLEDILRIVTPEVHEGLRQAVEIGKWPDGTPLLREQRELCMQALIAWEARNLPPEQRTGHIDRGSKADGDRCATPSDEPEVIRFIRDRGV
ncbi:MAG: YeaC family protein [Gammaproteobacteria bacterium]